MSKFFMAIILVLAFSFTPALADAPPAETVTETSKECAAMPDGEAVASSCQRCGDGYCAKQCGENEKTCPQDCGGVDS